jgi:hypothetical protein
MILPTVSMTPRDRHQPHAAADAGRISPEWCTPKVVFPAMATSKLTANITECP